MNEKGAQDDAADAQRREQEKQAMEAETAKKLAELQAK